MWLPALSCSLCGFQFVSGVQLVDSTSHASRDFGHTWGLEKGFSTIWGKTKWVSPAHMVKNNNIAVCV
jgi:hypothetical protein